MRVKPLECPRTLAEGTGCIGVNSPPYHLIVDSYLEIDVAISKLSLNVNLDKGDNNRGREARDCYLKLNGAFAGVRDVRLPRVPLENGRKTVSLRARHVLRQ